MLVLIILKLTNIHQEFRPRESAKKLEFGKQHSDERTFVRQNSSSPALAFVFLHLFDIYNSCSRKDSDILSLLFGQVHVRVRLRNVVRGAKISREPYGQNIWFKASEVKARSAQGQYLSNFHIRFIVLFVVQCFMIE